MVDSVNQVVESGELYQCLWVNTIIQLMPKGRLIIPSKFRESLGDEFVVTKGMDGCLFVYDNEEWKKFEEKLLSLPMMDKQVRQFTRYFLAGAASVEVEKQGRILIPSVLREFADITKDAVFSRCRKQN